MIFILDNSLIESNSYLRDLAKFLLLACEKMQKVKCSSSLFSYLENKVLTIDYLGKQDIELILSNEALFDISNVYQECFTTILVGTAPNMVTIHVAMKILQNNSRIVLENASNDWPTIKKWVEFFDNKIKTSHKTVNSFVHRAIEEKWLVQEHAGGGAGTIAVRLKSLADEAYTGIDKYKLTTVFDSDKSCYNEANGKNDSLHKYLIDNNIKGHELVKREIENYYSWEAYTQANKTTTSIPPTDNNDVYDYLDIEACKTINLHKRDMADMAAYMNPKRLIKRIQNNMGLFDGEYEIQKIILMFAKII